MKPIEAGLPEKKTKRFRLGKFFYYQYCDKFLFWANDIYISLGALRISICWSRTFVWSDKKFKKWAANIYWSGKKYYFTILNTSCQKKNTQHPDKYIAEMEMENYYNTP